MHEVPGPNAELAERVTGPPPQRRAVKAFEYGPFEHDSWRSRRALWVEVIVVMCLAVFPDIVRAAMYLVGSVDGQVPQTPWTIFGGIVARSLSVVAPFWLIVHLGGTRPSEFGHGRIRPLADVLIGAVLFVLMTYGPSLVTYPIAIAAHFSGFGAELSSVRAAAAHYAAPSGAWAWSAIAATGVINGYTEELIMRGYLIVRLRRLLGSAVGAIVVTSALWGAYHAYYGGYHMAYIGLGGAVLGAYFAWSKRLWPVVIAHVIGDIVPYWYM